MDSIEQFGRVCACPFCEAEATETFVYEENDNTLWGGHCASCQSEWEYFEDGLGRQHEFREITEA